MPMSQITRYKRLQAKKSKSQQLVLDRDRRSDNIVNRRNSDPGNRAGYTPTISTAVGSDRSGVNVQPTRLIVNIKRSPIIRTLTNILHRVSQVQSSTEFTQQQQQQLNTPTRNNVAKQLTVKLYRNFGDVLQIRQLPPTRILPQAMSPLVDNRNVVEDAQVSQYLTRLTISPNRLADNVSVPTASGRGRRNTRPTLPLLDIRKRPIDTTIPPTPGSRSSPTIWPRRRSLIVLLSPLSPSVMPPWDLMAASPSSTPSRQRLRSPSVPISPIPIRSPSQRPSLLSSPGTPLPPPSPLIPPATPLLPPTPQPPTPPLMPPPSPPRRRRRHADIPHRRTYRSAITATADELENLCRHPHHCGAFTDVCPHCQALYFTSELANIDSLRMSCCHKGAYSLQALGACPRALKDLYTGDGQMATEFRTKIRYINSLFAMASFKTSRPMQPQQGQGHWCFTVCGQIYHYTQGIPTPAHLAAPMLSHYYFLDVDAALARRNEFASDNISIGLLRVIETTLRRVNIYMDAYKTMGEELRARMALNQNLDNIIIGITKDPIINVLGAQQNPPLAPSRCDIAAVFEGDEPPFDVDLVLYPCRLNDPDPHRRHQELKALSPLADPMVYPILFPCGDMGYRTGMKYNPVRGRPVNKNITFSQYYRYRIYISDRFSTIHYAGKLFQQYIVDAWVKTEMNRLWWYKTHQQDYRYTAAEALRRLNTARINRVAAGGGGPQLQHVGRAIVLPSSFAGGVRYHQRRYLDSMTIVARHGKPDLFITFTCNPSWPEIKDNLSPHQKWEHRPDLVCRMFHLKLSSFMDDVVQKQIYGVLLNYQYVIEFQKRGLPHAHIVLTFVEDDRLREVEQIDAIISAQIPDKETQPLLYQRVAECQIHPPCGRLNTNAPCMKDGKCSKFYPKPYRQETELRVGSNRRPEYRRPPDGRDIFIPRWSRAVNNRRVVPYNAYALAKYNCHINFEAVGSLSTMKYLHKYIAKDPDSITLYVDDPAGVPVQPAAAGAAVPPAAVGAVPPPPPPAAAGVAVPPAAAGVAIPPAVAGAAVQPAAVAAGPIRIDEIQQYIDSRYVSGMEATWRIFNYHQHLRSHTVMVLPVHLPGDRDLTYNEDDDVEEIEQRLGKPSKLEAWFTLNRRNVQARRYKYKDIPEYFTWNDSNATWNARVQVSKMFGAVAEVGPIEGQYEKFFLRILLMRIPGALSYEDLRTLDDGQVCLTFREACQRRHWLVEEGGEFERCLREAELHHRPPRFRKLFAHICVLAVDEQIGQIPGLWETFRHSLIEDFRHQGMTRAAATMAALDEIGIIVARCRQGVRLEDLGIVYDPNAHDSDDDNDNENANNNNNNFHTGNDDEGVPINNDDDGGVQVQADGDGGQQPIEYKVSNLNKDQKIIFLRVLNACARIQHFLIPLQVYDDLGDDVTTDQILDRRFENTFYVDGPGGTGKTYLYNTLLTVLRDMCHQRTIAVAWTGIAANLLIDGTTVHRAFKLPLTLSETTVAGWDMQSNKSTQIRDEVALIIWDEAPMTPKFAVEAVDRYLKDIKRYQLIMGGKCVLFGGDYRQILPVVEGGNRHAIIRQTLKASQLWNEMVKLKLVENMRVARNPQQGINHPDLGNCTYGEWLLKLGENRLQFHIVNPIVAPLAPFNLIEIPPRFLANTINDLIDFVFNGNYTSPDNGSKAILAPTNAIVTEINNLIIDRINEREVRTYLSEDTYLRGEDDEFRAPLDLLNSIASPSLPPHALTLKKGATVMLIRNLDVEDGLCNGTRLRVLHLGEHLLECQTLTGENRGNRVYVPRLKMVVQDVMLPNKMARLQFPVRLAYAVTINKSQGQTLTKVGLCLKRPCFTHGQLYVAFSRVGHIDNVKIYIEDGGKQGSFKYRNNRKFTSNVVFGQMLEIDPAVDPRPATNLLPIPPPPTPPRRQLTPIQQPQPPGRNNDGDDSDPDYEDDQINNVGAGGNNNVQQQSDPFNEQAQIFDAIDVDQIMRVHGITDERDIPTDILQLRTNSQLLRRVAVDDRPGTSGLGIVSTTNNTHHDIPYDDDSSYTDSD